jgi:hypothetical protein
MKKLLCLLLLLHGVAAHTQSADQTVSEKKIGIDDSITQQLQLLKDSPLIKINLPDSAEISERISRNVNSMLELQRERKAKDKQAAIIRIGIGLGFLALLIIGWRRRKK